MVEVGDKVFVTPVNGQKDYIAVITGPGGGTGKAGTSGIIEGDYNLWTKKWLFVPSSGIYNQKNVSFYIDEENAIFYLWFINNNAKHAFGTYNLQDHSTIFESPSGSHYTSGPPDASNGEYAFHLGACALSYSAISRSHQTYMLLWRNTGEMMEVWRVGAKIWNRNLSTDSPQVTDSPRVATISLTGKYILVELQQANQLLLYEGFDAGTSTDITETVITDISKAWAANDLIGHIIYITSGGANGQQATITSNTGITITCSAATFVTWGMSVGDTFKID